MIIIDYICIVCIFTPPDRLARRSWISSKGHIASVEPAACSGFGTPPGPWVCLKLGSCG